MWVFLYTPSPLCLDSSSTREWSVRVERVEARFPDEAGHSSVPFHFWQGQKTFLQEGTESSDSVT